MEQIRLALRDTQRFLARSRVLAGCAIAVLALGLSGPFGTIDTIALVPRTGYWALVIGVTLSTGAFLSMLAGRLAAARGPRARTSWPTLLTASTAMAAAISLEVLAINWLTLGLTANRAGYVAQVIASAAILALSASLYFSAFAHSGADAPSRTPMSARLLSRLDPGKRGRLISISVSDHYVDVVTTGGSCLLLMRLSDAIGETEGIDGLQVHRSHWVATGEVVGVRRQGARGELTMSNGRTIPFSRTYLDALKKVGLLPS